MRSIIRHPITAACAFAATGLIFVACSESPTGPVTGPVGGGANATVVGSLPSLGTPKLTVQSGDASVHYCATNSTQAPVAATFPGTDCAIASGNLTAALGVYNPGWAAPLGASSWIGPTGLPADGANPTGAPSSDYATPPGSYEFVTTFSIPAGVTAPSLQLSAQADNAIVVYLNGVEIGQHTFLQDCTHEQRPNCNWNVPLLMNGSPATLNVGGSNTLRIDLVGTRIGLITDPGPPVPTAQSTCDDGPQPTGVGGVSTSPNHQVGGVNWSKSDCLNPAGLDFVANVFWTVPTPPPTTTWCSPGFWKNHGVDLWIPFHNTLYSTLVGAAPLKKPQTDGTLLDVVSNPSKFGGPATNSVADFLSNLAFGTPIGSGVENDPACDAFAKGPGIPAPKV